MDIIMKCNYCSGRGVIDRYMCPVDGWQAGTRCPRCHGSGTLEVHHNVEGYVETDPFCLPTLNADSDF